MNTARVVITGLGVISALGHNIEDFSCAVFSGKSGVSLLTGPEFASLPVRYASAVMGFNPESVDYEPKIIQHMDLFSLYGMAAAQQALEQSGLLKHSVVKDRVGICFGSGIGGLAALETQKMRLEKRGARGVSPFFIPSMLINMTAGHLSMRYGFQGPTSAPSTACCSSAHAIIQGYDWIKSHQADVVIVGGSESACTPLGIAGFAAAKALSSRFHETPETASRPFDAGRDGFVMGDGGAALVLESYEHAKARGADILCEIVGTGMSSDAYHMTSPDPSGHGAILAMQKALSSAGLAPDELGTVNLHATSTPRGDIAELEALKQVFGDCLPHIPLSATKSMTGHLLGASAALEAVISVLSLQKQKIPPCCHIENRDPLSEGVHLVMGKSLPYVFEAVLSNSFGFGGVNTALVFSSLRAK